MFSSILNSNQPRDKQQEKQKGEWFAGSFKAENFIPGLVIGFIFGLLLDLTKPSRNHLSKKQLSSTKLQEQLSVSSNGDRELKMVLVVRQDLKMKSGKIASQCAHAATGMYAELMQSDRSLLRQWEQCGQPKIVVTCRNQQEMNKLKDAAESIGLPTFVVADAGRTQVSAGSKTVLAVGPGKLPVACMSCETKITCKKIQMLLQLIEQLNVTVLDLMLMTKIICGRGDW
ncbi:hypothetical protein V8G54_006221 [Vigna mungo]|uniref:peptidyl-tRNA hydrolase n=1 Tax=Vigna mungo TaxID=3915 RepID=A0AAQ3NZG8_VIGMU